MPNREPVWHPRLRRGALTGMMRVLFGIPAINLLFATDADLEHRIKVELALRKAWK